MLDDKRLWRVCRFCSGLCTFDVSPVFSFTSHRDGEDQKCNILIRSLPLPSMSGRLASFRGPSTPTSSPARQPKGVPASPSRPVESTYHRKIRALLLEIRSATETWDDLIIFDGVKAARELVDTRTDLECVVSVCQDMKKLKTSATP